VLARFKEPSWNNPVVRFLDVDGKDVIERRDGVWSTQGLVARMIAALEAEARPVPEYLSVVETESNAAGLSRATFAMHCFWEGEAKLGALDGVVDTRAAFLEGKEVVEVTFDPAEISYSALIDEAQSLQCASTVYARDEAQLEIAQERARDRARLSRENPKDAPPSDQRYHLRQSILHYLPLTPMQAMKLNSALARTEDPSAFLSPRQRGLVKKLEATARTRPHLLKGLDPPRSNEQLGDYAERLEKKLSESE